MSKKIFWQGLVAGLLAALASVIYNRIYFFATETIFRDWLIPAPWLVLTSRLPVGSIWIRL